MEILEQIQWRVLNSTSAVTSDIIGTEEVSGTISQLTEQCQGNAWIERTNGVLKFSHEQQKIHLVELKDENLK